MNDKKYKAKLRIPKEMYAFIEIEVDGTLEEIQDTFRELTITSELKDKEFNNFIDRYLTGEPISAEEYENCSDRQKEVVQIIKRALKRIKSRQLLK